LLTLSALDESRDLQCDGGLPCLLLERSNLEALRKLRPSKRNPRTHSKKQISQLIASIQRFGWTSPIIVDEKGSILAGYGRYLAARELQLREAPVMVVSGLSDVEKRALALADNKIAANAGWHRKLLAEELGELAQLLPECNLDLEITGFEAPEIDSLFSDLVDPELDPADEVPPPSKLAISKIGDLWELGHHKLLCGNAQSTADVRRVMGGKVATMVITDPPYNLPIKQVQGRGRIKHGNFPQGAGEMSSAQFIQFLRIVLSLAAKPFRERRHPFCFYGLAAHSRASRGRIGRLFRAQERRGVGEDQRGPRQFLSLSA
jgi:ParB-like nuclease domain